MWSSVPWMTSTGHWHPLAERLDPLAHRTVAPRAGRPSYRPGSDGAIWCAQATQSSICLVECGSVNSSEKKNRAKSS